MNDLLPLFDDAELLRQPIVMAGPCSAESETQLLLTARELRPLGVKIFRAGIWKPRTKPGGFEGVGEPALPWLVKVARQTGMRPATEVATAGHVAAALEAGIEIFWIGARTSANPFAVQEIADFLSQLSEGKRNKLTVLVKNPVNPDLELWIGALERIYGSGIRRLGAIHRGFSSYGTHLYRNPPKWAIPIELHRRFPALPILCDPSHIGGKRELVATLSQQALEMGFAGLIIESHCEPECALSDSAQQVTPAELGEILKGLVIPEHAIPSESLELLRSKIDRIDDELLELLARRMQVSRDIGKYKRANNLPIVQPLRYNDLMQRRVSLGSTLDINPDFLRSLLALIHEESVRQQL